MTPPSEWCSTSGQSTFSTPLRGLAAAPEPTVETWWEGREVYRRRAVTRRAEYTHGKACRKTPAYAEIVRIAGVTIGVLAALAGAVWVAQGLNLPLAPRSFMTADRTWFVIGVATAIGGVALATWSWRRA